MTSEFSNQIILPEDLPILNKEEFNPIDPKYLKLIYIRLLIISAFFALTVVGLFMIPDEESPKILPWIVGGILLFIVVFTLIISKISFSYRGYLIREKDIAYQRGLISYKLSSIPYKRIQHVELNQGPLAKKMKLAAIKIFTAGGSSDDLNIPGLPIDKAKEIRAFLTEIISSDESV